MNLSDALDLFGVEYGVNPVRVAVCQMVLYRNQSGAGVIWYPLASKAIRISMSGLTIEPATNLPSQIVTVSPPEIRPLSHSFVGIVLV